MNSLRQFFEENKGDALDKWLHYFEIYDRYFSKYRNTPVTILEIGVFQGGSLGMWRAYFGKEAKIYAIDINPSCKRFEADNTQVFIGSQEDRKFLTEIKNLIPKVDILIDDGGHTMKQQIVTFDELFSHIKDDGLYLCEDLHTSYWSNYGGGYKRPGSFIEYSKNFIDSINAWHSRSKKLPVNDFTRTAYGLHYYDSVLVIEKREMRQPQSKMTGNPSIPIQEFHTAGSGSKTRSKLMENLKSIFKAASG